MITRLVLAPLLAVLVSTGHFHNGLPGPAARITNRVSAELVNGLSVNFDGDNDHCSIGKPSDMNFNSATDAYTLALWIKRGENADFERHAFSKATMSSVDVTATLGVTNNEEIMSLTGGGENGHGGSISDHGWHMESLSVTGGIATLYLDGSAADDPYSVGSDVNTAADWIIGSSRWDDNIGTGYPFKGKIDEVTVWVGTFTAGQHLELYNGGEPMNPAAHTRAAVLTHWYRMGDDDTYPTLTDQIGTADATCVNLAGAGNYQSDVP